MRYAVRPMNALPLRLDAATYRALTVRAARLRARWAPNGRDVPSARALVHEAWEKVVRSGMVFVSDGHFEAVVTRAMRQILVDRLRARATAKRGAGAVHEDLCVAVATGPDPETRVQVRLALERLEADDAVAAFVACRRAVQGATVPEVATELAVSASTVDRAWRVARSYLTERL